MLIIFSTQVGNLNRPGCYPHCNEDGYCGTFGPLQTWDIVKEGLGNFKLYPGILFGFLGLQVAVCVGLLVVFWSAKKVHLQDDKPLPEVRDKTTLRERGEEQA